MVVSNAVIHGANLAFCQMSRLLFCPGRLWFECCNHNTQVFLLQMHPVMAPTRTSNITPTSPETAVATFTLIRIYFKMHNTLNVYAKCPIISGALGPLKQRH